MTHTPGPWRLYNDKVRTEPFTENGELLICRCEYRQDMENASEMWANGNLIAAAPDLLEACERLHADIDYLQKLWGKEGITDTNVQRLKAAIVKAKGEA